jgi:hypothetical protein
MQVCSAAILGLATARRRHPWSGPRALAFSMANWMSVLVEAVQVVERQVQTRPGASGADEQEVGAQLCPCDDSYSCQGPATRTPHRHSVQA